MGDSEPLKAAIASVLDAAASELTAFGEDIFDHAEIGFREERTASRVADALRALELAPRQGLALTGVKAHLAMGRPGPTISVMGELDGHQYRTITAQYAKQASSTRAATMPS